jgi:hypothetical protein
MSFESWWMEHRKSFYWALLIIFLAGTIVSIIHPPSTFLRLSSILCMVAFAIRLVLIYKYDY